MAHVDSPDSFAKQVGARIRKLRQERGLSQRELAGDRISPGFLSQVERGLTSPSLNSLHLIANNLGVTPSALLPEVVQERKRHECRVWVLLSLAESQLHIGDTSGAQDTVDRAQQIIDTVSDAPEDIRAALSLQCGLIGLATGDHDSAFTHLTESAELYEAATEPAGTLKCLLALGEMHLERANPLPAVRFFDTVLNRLRDAQLQDSERYDLMAKWGLVRSYRDLGETRTAAQLLEGILGAIASLVDVQKQVEADVKCTLGHLDQDVLREALDGSARARALAEWYHLRRVQADAQYTMGTVAEDEGQRDRALAALSRACELSGELGQQHSQARALLMSGRIHLRRGDLRSSAEAAKTALETTDAATEPVLHGQAALLAGRVAAAQNQLDRAKALLNNAEECFRTADHLGLLARTQNELGKIFLTEGQREQALRRFHRASELFSRISTDEQEPPDHL